MKINWPTFFVTAFLAAVFFTIGGFALNVTGDRLDDLENRIHSVYDNATENKNTINKLQKEITSLQKFIGPDPLFGHLNKNEEFEEIENTMNYHLDAICSMVNSFYEHDGLNYFVDLTYIESDAIHLDSCREVLTIWRCGTDFKLRTALASFDVYHIDRDEKKVWQLKIEDLEGLKTFLYGKNIKKHVEEYKAVD